MIILRDAVPADAIRLGALFSDSRAVLDFLPQLHSREEDLAFIAEHIMPRHAVTVAEREGRIAGYIAQAPNWIEQLYVDPCQFRQGVASRLLHSAMQRQEMLELWCFEQNRAGRALYERFGFWAVRRTDGADNAERSPDILYRWERGRAPRPPDAGSRRQES